MLIVPLAVLLVGSLFTTCQGRAQSRIEEQRVQDAALQAYLDQMGSLMLEHNLRAGREFNDVNSIARARTLTLLRQLDGSRKGTTLQFLRDSGLIRSGIVGVVLIDADFSGVQVDPDAQLSDADLYQADLSNADLSGSNLEHSIFGPATVNFGDLSHTNLRHADFKNATLTDADLSYADLTGADLSGTILSNANLTGAKVTDEQLASCKSLNNAVLPNGSREQRGQ